MAETAIVVLATPIRLLFFKAGVWEKGVTLLVWAAL